jgi:hypothetical protein
MITVLVEGPGDKLALPVLTRRESGQSLIRCVDLKGKSNIVRRNRGFEDTVRRQSALGEQAFIILMDGDVTSAPYQSLEEERRDMHRRAQALAQELDVSVEVCWAVLEMESWLIGGIQPKSTYCGLHKVGQVPNNTETSPRDPKKWLEDRMIRRYKPRTQKCLACRIDIQKAKNHNRSMQSFFTTTRHATTQIKAKSGAWHPIENQD